MIVAAVPVKDLVNAKQRLVPVLTAGERRALAHAMLGDVLRALAAARLDAVWVITRDPDVTALARALGAEPVTEAENRGHTAAVAFAQAAAAAARARVFVTVPGDVPCVTGEEVRRLVAGLETEATGAVFTPSRSGLGTNGVALAPPGAMPLTFGEPSFENHLVTARRLGVGHRVVPLPGLGLDIDAPEDLRTLLADGRHTESGRLVATFDLGARLPAARAPLGRR